VTLLTHWEGEPITVWQQLWDVPVLEAHHSLGSTNERAGELAREGAPALTTVLAEEQTSGRGRGGKVWRSPPAAGLWLSTVLRHDDPVQLALPLLVGLAAARAIEAATEAVWPDVHVGIKWPNDLFLDGRPSDIALTAASLEGVSGRPVRRGEVATHLMDGLRRLCGPSLSDAVGGLCADLGPRDILANRKVLTSQGPGTARGIDGSGALILERPDGVRVLVMSGSVELA